MFSKKHGRGLKRLGDMAIGVKNRVGSVVNAIRYLGKAVV